MNDTATRHEDYPLPRFPITLYDAHQRQLEAELMGILERHPEEVEAIERVRQVMGATQEEV